jgi:hypothetical protein
VTAEWVAALSSLATFVVIAASALAALAQLRHMRNANQIQVFNDVRQTLESPEYEAAVRFILFEVPKRIDDPAFRAAALQSESPESEPYPQGCQLFRWGADAAAATVAPAIARNLLR